MSLQLKSIASKIDKILEWYDTGCKVYEETSTIFANIPLIAHREYAKLNVYVGEEYEKVNVYFNIDITEENRTQLIEFIDDFNIGSNLRANIKGKTFIISIIGTDWGIKYIDELICALYKCDKDVKEITSKA